jgi:hypothetical protein
MCKVAVHIVDVYRKNDIYFARTRLPEPSRIGRYESLAHTRLPQYDPAHAIRQLRMRRPRT